MGRKVPDTFAPATQFRWNDCARKARISPFVNRLRATCLLVACATLTCTDAGLYAVGAGGVGGPDKAELRGTACVPLAVGEAFPVKVLFAVEGGAGLDRTISGEITNSLNVLASRFAVPYISFAFVAYHAVATGIRGTFVDATTFAGDIPKYSAYQEGGPVSMRAPLKLAESILSGDMQTGCRGLVARTRYLVVLVAASPDTACANPVFNAGIDSRCNAFLPNEAQCSACELERVTANLKAIGERYGAGEVAVQPVYVRTTGNSTTQYQMAAVARAGGSSAVETDPAALSTALNSLNYASLQRALKLKRLIAFNRNVIFRNGAVLADSDGDGVPDVDEAALGTDPAAGDTDNDGLMDGVEVRMGLRPQPGNVDIVKGCNPFLDTDADRLNDCEERVLGTDACISDSDGDGLPDLVELLGGTNPLIAEDLNDNDRDGATNVEEVIAHTDPNSADVAFREERGYGYTISEAAPTIDGRACYDISAYNLTLVQTLARPNPPFPTIPRGTNDLYLYFQVGRENDPRGTGIGSLLVSQVQFIPPNRKRPKAVIDFVPDEMVLGN